MRGRIYFVAGATGRQGGAVARHLLSRGARVRAFSRNPGAPQARLLQRLGAQLYPGSFEDPVPLEEAMRGCDAAFSMTCFAEAGVEAEVRQGRALARAARRAGVPHLVHSSMAGADHPTGVPHVDSKAEIERYLAHAGVSYTILAPVFFMENWLAVLPTAFARGTLAYPLPARRTLQMVAVDDLAAFACSVLARPGGFENRRVEIAGEARPMEEVAAVLGRAAGRPLGYAPVPLEVVWRRSEGLGRLCSWLDREGTRVDVDRLRSRYREVGWTTLESWARRQRWDELLGPPEPLHQAGDAAAAPSG